MDAAAVNAAIAAAIAAHVAAQGQPAAAVNVVGVKLPDFWTTDPDMWFRQAEAAFRRSNITVSSTKFDHVLMKLPESVVTSVRNLIAAIQPGDGDAYERLKEQLTASYQKTRWQKAFSLIKHPDLGDRRPSAMMSEMLALLPDGASGDDTLFLAHFLLRLPASMRDHLAAADLKTAADMARQADVLWDVRAGETAIAAVSSAMGNMSLRSASPRDSRRRSPESRRSPDRRRDNRSRQPRRQTPGRDNSSSFCFYHGKYGKKAHKCEAPCAWVEN